MNRRILVPRRVGIEALFARRRKMRDPRMDTDSRSTRLFARTAAARSLLRWRRKLPQPAWCHMTDQTVHSPYEEALQLARRIEDLVATAPVDASRDPHGARLAQALAGNLIDQLNALRGQRAA